MPVMIAPVMIAPSRSHPGAMMALSSAESSLRAVIAPPAPAPRLCRHGLMICLAGFMWRWSKAKAILSSKTSIGVSSGWRSMRAQSSVTSWTDRPDGAFLVVKTSVSTTRIRSMSPRSAV